MSRILIVEDEQHLADGLRFNLEAECHDTEVVESGEAALQRLLHDDPPIDVVVLDVMLPGMSGFEVAAQLRQRHRYVPILMLTARGRAADIVEGFQVGADDYLPKPFDPRELVARMQAILRRGTQRENDAVCVGGLTIDRSTRGAVFNGAALMLTGAEFDVLDLLVRNRGRVLSRDRIIEAMHGVDWDAYDRSIDVLVSRVRQKLGDSAKRATLIRTVRGAGYSFAGDAGG
jgi:DNA-binding response OmpR family regulator